MSRIPGERKTFIFFYLFPSFFNFVKIILRTKSRSIYPKRGFLIHYKGELKKLTKFTTKKKREKNFLIRLLSCVNFDYIFHANGGRLKRGEAYLDVRVVKKLGFNVFVIIYMQTA